MNANSESESTGESVWKLGRADVFSVRTSEVLSGVSRLEAAFYGSEGYRAVQSLHKSGFDFVALKTLAEVEWHGPFGRTYVDDAKYGVPFVSSADMLEAKIVPDRFISRRLTHRLERLMVRDGQVLVSCSGTIGNVALCTEDFNGLAVSQHAIRVSPSETASLGVLYCMLQSEAGQFLLKRSKSGSVIDSLYADDVEALPVPRLPRALREELGSLVTEAKSLRVSANRLLGVIELEVQRSCFLPDLASLRPKNQIGSDSRADVFTTKASERLQSDHAFGEYRLDASYHSPMAVTLRKHILGMDGGTELAQVISSVRNSGLRKRVYVSDRSLGVPLLGGKQLMQVRPHDVKLLSKALTRNLPTEIVQNGWTLVSSGGTLGRTLFVHRNLEGSSVSQDVMRVIPDANKAAPGFIYAFLASPYGQLQIQQRGYGSVIPRLRDFQFNSIAIRLPKDKGEAIHQKVVQAFDARADAQAKEDSALKLFMSALANGRAYVESEWGKEY